MHKKIVKPELGGLGEVKRHELREVVLNGFLPRRVVVVRDDGGIGGHGGNATGRHRPKASISGSHPRAGGVWPQ